MLSKADTLGGHFVDVWCFYFSLAVTAEVTVAEVVNEYKDDVWFEMLFSERKKIVSAAG